jgi:hypothetical protein
MPKKDLLNISSLTAINIFKYYIPYILHIKIRIVV